MVEIIVQGFPLKKYTLSTSMIKEGAFDDLFITATGGQVATGISGVSANAHRTIETKADGIIHLYFRKPGGASLNSFTKFTDLTYWVMLNIGDTPAPFKLNPIDLTEMATRLYRANKMTF